MASKLNLMNENGKVLSVSSGSISEDKVLEPSDFKYIRDTISSIGSISKPLDGDVCFVKGYHSSDDSSGGTFIYRSNTAKTEHNGGTFIDPNKVFPSDWNDSTQLDTWLTGDGTGNGVWERIYTSKVDIKWFGAKGDGITDDALVLQKAANYSVENNSALFISKGIYLVSSVTINGNSNNFIMLGEENNSNKKYSNPSKIIFNDDGNTSNGSIGININCTTYIKNILFTTNAGDARSKDGDFIGLVANGNGLKIRDCIFESCSGSALKVSDLGYAEIEDCIFRYNNEGLTAYYINWTYGTTTKISNIYGFQNNICLNVNKLTNSNFENCVFEYNSYGIKNFSSNCSIKNSYFEQNYEYGAYAKVSSATLLHNYSHGDGDSIYTTGDTSTFGFGAIGSAVIDSGTLKSKQLKFYDRNGNDSKLIKCNDPEYSGQLVLQNTANKIEGIIPTMLSAQSSGYATKMYTFLLHGTDAYGVPDGFTVTHDDTGKWSIDWNTTLVGTSKRFPIIMTQGITHSATSSDLIQTDIFAQDGGSGIWKSYENMSMGFKLNIYTVDPSTGEYTLADEDAMVLIIT